jgi:nitrite reductase/ring-hydroxylating ferredoxin subunit
MAGTIPGKLNGLVDADGGIVSREIFVSEEIYRQELEQVFARAWLFVGHESQIPRPGDFLASSMGEESVILCRDRGGRVHVFLNSCRHRGMKVCRYDEGNTAEFLCPYHGWSYATDGALVGVPFQKNAYGERLDKSKWGLVEVAQACSYKGAVWATWDRAAPSFLDYLGGYTLYLDLLLDAWDGREGGTEVIGGIQKWLVPCNWKFPAENFSGDRYHNVSHRSVDLVGIGPSGTARRDMRERSEARLLDVCIPDRGHSMIAFLRSPTTPILPAYQDSPAVAAYFLRCEEDRQRRRGAGARLMGGPGTVFPNMSPLARQPRTLAVWHPRGPHQTEVWRWYLVDADAPAEVKDFLRHYYLRYSGPASSVKRRSPRGTAESPLPVCGAVMPLAGDPVVPPGVIGLESQAGRRAFEDVPSRQLADDAFDEAIIEAKPRGDLAGADRARRRKHDGEHAPLRPVGLDPYSS